MTTTLVFDLESDGFLDTLTTIHSLVIKDVETGAVLSCHDHGGGLPIQFGLKALLEGDVIVGHNIQEFDIPAIKKVYPWFTFTGTVRDTLIISRLIYADLTAADFERERKLKRKWIDKHLFGRHSLEAWGQRLGLWKGDYSDMMKAKGLDPWASWNQEMQNYCVQDVEVNTKLWDMLMAKGFSEESIQLEHDVRRIVSRQEAHGFSFDEAKAHELEGTLLQRKHDLEQKLLSTFKPWYRNLGEDKVGKTRNVQQKHLKPTSVKTNKKTGAVTPIYPKAHYEEGAQFSQVKLVPFNPTSRFDIADRLVNLFGWKPEEFTNDGHPKVDDETLVRLPWPEAKLLATYLMVQKRIGQLSTGKEAWLKAVKNGRIHGRVTTNGAVTGRMTHSKPNVAQVPSSRAPYGHECRELFRASPGMKLVGTDADALELRCLAGYMAVFDKGAYIATVLEGKKEDGTDMHSINAAALGCSRDTAKTWFYAFIYGAGDFKLGTVLGVEGTKEQIMAAGKKSRAKFLKALPALGKLVEAVQDRVRSKKPIKGADGRILSVRSSHAALNTLLQSAGAIFMKKALVILDNRLQELGLVPGVDYEFVANVHDEVQVEVKPEHTTTVAAEAPEAIRKAGAYYSFRCPLAGNSEVGDNWAATH